MSDEKTILISGGFSPTTIGHLYLIEDAKKYGRVIIALNSDLWLKRKVGFVFMGFEERKQILKSMRNVYDVIAVDDYDGSVNSAIEQIRPNFFGVGCKESKIPELELCKKMGIDIVWNLAKDVVFNSTDVVDCMINNLLDNTEPYFKK